MRATSDDGGAAVRSREARRRTTGSVETMRYLTLSADVLWPRIAAVEGEATVEHSDLGLSASLAERIAAWNDEYQPIMQLGATERLKRAAVIGELDRRGKVLAAEIATELAPAKVAYYSEGQLRLLSPEASSPDPERLSR